MAKSKDITQTGALTYKDLQKENNLNLTGKVLTREEFGNIGADKGWIGSAQGARQVLAKNAQVSDIPVQSPLYQQSGGTDYYGKSMFDEDITVGEGDWEHLINRAFQCCQNLQAVTIMDIGTARAIKKKYPELKLHVSTAAAQDFKTEDIDPDIIYCVNLNV